MTDSTEMTDTLQTDVTLTLPVRMVLPVYTDADGYDVPCTGFISQKYLDHSELTTMGVAVSWQDANGNDVSLETVLSLIEAAKTRSLQTASLSSHDPS